MFVYYAQVCLYALLDVLQFLNAWKAPIWSNVYLQEDAAPAINPSARSSGDHLPDGVWMCSRF
jgi:hypothetical protein